MDKISEWRQVYESRMSINLLEPWEKCLAYTMLTLMLLLTYYICTLIFNMLSRVL